jgi:hypothetical protein
MAEEYIKKSSGLMPIGSTQGLVVPVPFAHIELTGVLTEGYKASGQKYMNAITWDYSPASDRSIPITWGGAHPNSGNPFLHFNEPGLYQITIINRTSSDLTVYPTARAVKWVLSGYVSETPTLATTGVAYNGTISVVKHDAIPKHASFNFVSLNPDYCINMSGEYLELNYDMTSVTNTVTLELQIVKLQAFTSELIANKGALVSGGAFQFDIDGHGYTENYSTTEMKVGTWINGKPLYKKTLAGSIQAGASGAYLDTVILSVADVAVLNPDQVIRTDGYWAEAGSSYFIGSAEMTTFCTFIIYRRDGNKTISLKTQRSGDRNGGTYAISIYYTKTTD